MALKLYIDLMSQPSRALYILLKTAKCEFEPKLVDLRTAEHYGEEFTKVNRFQRVPVIDHNGFVLTESVAIMKYLSRENMIPESLYPKESKKAARVEQYLEWQHIGLRLHCSMFFRVKATFTPNVLSATNCEQAHFESQNYVKSDCVLIGVVVGLSWHMLVGLTAVEYMNPVLAGINPDPKQVASYERRMVGALEDFDTKWLGQGHAFIAGDTPTVADLLAACELEQPRMAGFDPKEKFANIAAWYPKVRAHFNPYYDEAHVILNKVVVKQAAVAAKL